ncbi:MAG: acyl-CoA dehydratase activase-related protein, partial [Bacteroidota bacterium]|nr:acyl-CoA dehydratase activase-related protein [Bacteroidota bacterium]
MAKKVGIPRSLFYYQYYPLWKTFMEELGAELVLSDYTSKSITDEGVKLSVDEACLPVKIFHGHVNDLKDKVDYMFIPRFTSVSKDEYICPKFGGLPDMIRHSIPDLPQIIDAEVNLRKSKKNALKTAFEVGNYFTGDKKKIKKAYGIALKSYRNFRKKVEAGALPSDLLGNRKTVLKKHGDGMLNIAVIGHVYNLYDNYVNMDLIFKLNSNGANV